MREQVKIFMTSENNQDIYNEIISYMKENEYIVKKSTSNYDKLLDEITLFSPDILLLDINLRKGDGISLVQNCKNDVMLHDMRTIFITDVKAQRVIDVSYDIGIDYYFILGQETKFIAKIIERIVGIHCEQKRKKYQERELSLEQKNLLLNSKLENDITGLIREIGIPAHIKGYQYIRDSIIMAIKEPDSISYITKFLYPTIAKKYKTTTSSVERAIRHAIEVAWKKGLLNEFGGEVGYVVHFGVDKPTNSEFIAVIADKFRLDYRIKGLISDSYSA